MQRQSTFAGYVHRLVVMPSPRRKGARSHFRVSSTALLKGATSSSLAALVILLQHGRNNWPPGPFPLIFHDIEQEIPEASRSTVLTLYRVWMFLVVTLIFNFIAGILLLTSGGKS